MKCQLCNFENTANARFCAKCGAAFDAKASKLRKKSKNNKPKIKSDTVIQMLIYLVIAALTVGLIYFGYAVSVHSLFDDSVSKSFSLFGIIKNLIVGTERVNPTAISIIIGLTAMIIAFLSAFFWLITFFARLIRKPYYINHIMALIFTVLNIASMILIVPVADRFSGILKYTCAQSANLLIDDIGSINFLVTILFAIVLVALILTELIFAFKERRRLNDEIKE